MQNQSVLYRKDKSGKEELFLDPNTFSADGTTSLSSVEFSKDGSLVAYSISEAGSDWNKIIILNAITKEKLESELVDVKFSGISWIGNEGFIILRMISQPEASFPQKQTSINCISIN